MPPGKSKPVLELSLEKYGFRMKQPLNPLQWEQVAFSLDQQPKDGGLGRYGHFRNMCAILAPQIEWNDWLEDQIESLCSREHVYTSGKMTQRIRAWWGCAGSGKTFAAALYAFIAFWSDPFNTVIILTSTEGKMVRRRIWPVIQSLYVGARKAASSYFSLPEVHVSMGNMIDSKTTLQSQKGDDKHAIFGLAVAKGETQKAVAFIQGIHAKHIFVLIDEATDTPEAIIGACHNLTKACEDFTLLLTGNPKSRIDVLGRMSIPKAGWETISVNSDQWQTWIEEFQMPGICLHFDGFKSPNVEKGRTLYRYIYTHEDYEKAVDRGEDDLHVWQFDRGFPPPDDLVNSVLTPSMVDRCDARGEHLFKTYSRTLASLDPAFGGDKCVLVLARVGDISSDGKVGITIQKTIEIKAKADANLEVDAQIARQVIQYCVEEKVDPGDFAMDATGTGRGVFSHLYADWSNRILRVEFGGSPSELPASSTDIRPSKEVYDRRVTELWFSVREFVLAGQLKGLNREMVEQFCTRMFEIKARKYRIETKDEVKARIGRSPDEADAVAVLVELARSQGLQSNGTLKVDPGVEWTKRVDEVNAVYAQIDYADEEIFDVEVISE